MLLLVLLFIVIGDFMDAVPAIIIFMPIVIKLNELGDIKPLHMGVVLITTLVFGLITPPYGLSLLVASKFVGVRFSRAMFASLPIYVVFFVTIAFTVLFPGRRALSAEAAAAGIGRLLQEPDRRRLHLPAVAAAWATEKSYSRAGLSTRMRRRIASSGVHSLNRSSRWPASGISPSMRGCGQSVPHTSCSGLAATSASWNGARVRIVRRALADAMRAGELHPAAALAEQPQQALEARAPSAEPRVGAAHVIDHHRQADRFQGRDRVGQILHVDPELQVPAELLHDRRERRARPRAARRRDSAIARRGRND